MTIEKNNNKIDINFPGSDFVQIEFTQNKGRIQFKACHQFTATMMSFKKNFGVNVSTWPLPQGNTHSEIIIREMILKLQGKWNYPYNEEELCHCRHVNTQSVDEAIINGAHTSELASQWTGCSTACGTCKPEVEKIINYRIIAKS